MPDTPHQPSSRGSASTRLEGWKEISAHFGKGVRTVQRWEAELDMPIHRMVMAKGETVYALVGELEAWRRRLEPRAAAREAAAAGPGGPGAGPGFAEPTDGGGRASHGDGNSVPAAATPRRVGWITVAGVAIMVLVAIGWAARNAFSTRPVPGSGASLAQPARAQVEGAALAQPARAQVEGNALAQPARAQVEGNALAQPARAQVERNDLVAYDGDGRVLWRHQFDFRLTPGAYEDSRRTGYEPVVIDDIDDDGNDEVLFVAEPFTTAGHGALFCFERSGKLRFVHRPEYQVTFGPLRSAPPYRPVFVKVFGETGHAHRIWFVSYHLQEFPTVVEELDPTGAVVGHYWSDGQVTVLDEGALDGRQVALVGAIDNETHGASLAVLDVGRPTATAPAESDHYRCADCAPSAPLAFLVFPALDATMAIMGYARVDKATLDSAGQISLTVSHGGGDVISATESRDEANTLYVVDRQFRVVKAELGQGYAAVHRLFEEKGYLKHPFGSAADAHLLWPVRRWNPAKNRFDLVTGVETGR